MHFPQSLHANGFSPLLSQERLDALCAQTPVPPDLRTAVAKWMAKVVAAKAAGETLKESEHERDFVLDIFQTGLGYKGPGFTGALTLRTQFGTATSVASVRGKPMDAALGRFASSGASTGGTVSVVIESKGTDCDLDTSRNSNGQTAPDQAFAYATICREGTPNFIIVTNLKEIRLYRFQQRITRFWRFDLEEQAILPTAEAEGHLKELAFLLAPEQLLPIGDLKARLDLTLDVTEEAPASLAESIHKEIDKVILGFQKILLSADGAPESPGDAERDSAWQGGQHLVSRMLFCGFVNKHGLLEPMLFNTCKQVVHPLNPLSKWDGLQLLFRAMDTGFSKEKRVLVPHFNGGLFRYKIGLDDIKPKPGALLDDTIDSAFNLANVADLDSGSTLLGQIFEQGLKHFEARTIKQVQDGIIYTPEYICRAVTVQTLSPLVRDAFKRADSSLVTEGITESHSLFAFHQFRRRWDALASLRIIDPACGSGAFLASALHFLKFIVMEDDAINVRSAFASLPEPIHLSSGPITLLEAMEGHGEKDPASERSQALEILLGRKPMELAIFGQDLHAEAVSYAQLAVWTKGVERADIVQLIGEHQNPDTAVLVNLDEQIVTGNSLVSKATWSARFPTVFACDPIRTTRIYRDKTTYLKARRGRTIGPSTRGTRTRVHYLNPGFDAVLANPPYVKIQDLVDSASRAAISSIFPEVATGSFDLCTPFIHLGFRDLLASHGRMGMIAPTPWTLVKYGEGLRQVLATGQNLEGVVHFRDHQIFDGVMTYTALWFFTATPCEAGVWLVDAPTGIRDQIAGSPYEPIAENAAMVPMKRIVPWSELPVQVKPAGREMYWPIWAPSDVGIRDSVQRRSANLEDYLDWDTTKGGAFQGIVTGMNDFFYVRESSPGSPGSYFSGLENTHSFLLEPHLVRPLLDSGCVERYAIKDLGRRSIFPYFRTATGDWNLIDLPSFPKFQNYANRHKAARAASRGIRQFQGLENRNGIDRSQWWEYSRKQNLEKQSLTKLVFPTTVQKLTFALDDSGQLLDNARIYGLATGDEEEGYFLLGVLNASLATWFAKRISVPKAGGFFEPLDFCLRKLPIPLMEPKEKLALIALAKRRHKISLEISSIDPASPSAANDRIALDDEAGKKERAIDEMIKNHYGFTSEEWEQVRNT
ncbi:MAG: Eco57I restriction-modification methylase domain-containing protein [Acidobacteria bacterium]|nr:Eco57I restriction-modification methylase domain-containing protein [Acidobacteriota bacterium]MBI3486932.1 Eco57I restriction-modification methylase domain-containing protein [Acidobacteriota bacterium]